MEMFSIILTIFGVLIMGLIAVAITAAIFFLIKWGMVLILAGTTTSVVKTITGKTKRRKSTKK